VGPPLGAASAGKELRSGRPLIKREEEPLISVVIPCFNQERFLADAIESVLAQNRPAGEVIVVDDGSTDGSREVAAAFPGVIVDSQPNGGLAAARNRGIARSRGSFLVFLDADDRLLPNALEANLEALSSHHSAALAAGHCRIIDSRGEIVAEYPQRAGSGDLYLALVRGNFIAMPGTVMYRRSAIEKLGGFDSSVDAAADYDLYLRIALHFGMVVHSAVIGEYRRHDGNMSNNVPLMLASTLKVARRNRRHVQRIPGGREAYRAGLEFWREKYGSRLVHGALFALEERRFGDAFRTAVTLATYDRKRLWSVTRGARESNTVPFVVIPNGLTGGSSDDAASRAEVPRNSPEIVKLHPASTAPGVAFNVQPNGESALCLTCRNAPPDAIVMFDGQPLETTVGGPDIVTAIVPRDFFAAAGSFPVRLRTSR
jgi:glycosyltransferase involved in cell wall biosynthesis